MDGNTAATASNAGDNVVPAHTGPTGHDVNQAFIDNLNSMDTVRINLSKWLYRYRTLFQKYRRTTRRSSILGYIIWKGTLICLNNI